MEINKKEKPIALIIEECKKQIINVINTTHLPAYILDLIIKDIHNEIVVIKEKEIKEFLEEYLNEGLEENDGKD